MCTGVEWSAIADVVARTSARRRGILSSFMDKLSFMYCTMYRCGVGLLELVFCPDLQHGEEAAALAQELTLILQTLNITG